MITGTLGCSNSRTKSAWESSPAQRRGMLSTASQRGSMPVAALWGDAMVTDRPAYQPTTTPAPTVLVTADALTDISGRALQ
jgi:hypothetical protein